MHDAATREFAETFVTEDQILANARSRANEVGCGAVAQASGATLRFLAAAVSAKAVVEVGTGAGVSGLWLLRGMRSDGVLTSIDTEAEYQRLARAAFLEDGIAPSRFRLINGRALEVMPRLADGSYDLMVVDAVRADYSDYLVEAIRLLRPGGVVAFDSALGGGRVADPTARDSESIALRELARTMRDHEQLIPAILPVNDGLLVAARRG